MWVDRWWRSLVLWILAVDGKVEGKPTKKFFILRSHDWYSRFVYAAWTIYLRPSVI